MGTIEDSINNVKSKLISNQLRSDFCGPDATCAAILVPLVKKTNEWSLLFTRRSDSVASHQNEVSFPGGSFEQQDSSLESTALRETMEEIGIAPEKITMLGSLPYSTTITGYKVFPFVGFINWPVEFKINPAEVKSVFTIPLAWLKDERNYYEADYHSPEFGVRKVIHYQEFQGEHLWGYTARVTRQFLELLK